MRFMYVLLSLSFLANYICLGLYRELFRERAVLSPIKAILVLPQAIYNVYLKYLTVISIFICLNALLSLAFLAIVYSSYHSLLPAYDFLLDLELLWSLLWICSGIMLYS